MGCFLCNPERGQPTETAWDWSSPRGLCSPHKLLARLEDGQLLSEALQRVAPDDSPLDGSVLGWIFSPVLVEAEGHRTVRGWTDFVAGGMAVLEDRFVGQSYFEFRGCEVTRAVDLLHALRAADRPPSTLGEVATVARARPPQVTRIWADRSR